MDENKITPFYTEDHDKLDEHFQCFQKTKRQDYARAGEYFEKFESGLRRHIAWEEEILFPLFEEKTGMTDGGPTFVMREEHRQIKALLEEVHKKVQRRDPESDREEQQLFEVLKQHNYKEEAILYPAIDRAASDEEREAVFKKMKTDQ